jgi:hypothetical protein
MTAACHSKAYFFLTRAELQGSTRSTGTTSLDVYAKKRSLGFARMFFPLSIHLIQPQLHGYRRETPQLQRILTLMRSLMS